MKGKVVIFSVRRKSTKKREEGIIFELGGRERRKGNSPETKSGRMQ
jgi:hypothetical protein